MESVIRQGRELGIAMIIIDQHPHLISSAVLGNTFSSIFLNLKDPADINKAAGLCQIDENEKRYFSMLRVGEGIVKLQNRFNRPFLVKFPLVEVQKGSVTDDVLRRHLVAGSRSNGIVDKVYDQVRQVRLSDSILRIEELLFLNDVLQHRDDGVKVRYKRLGWSVDKGNSCKRELVATGWLDEALVSFGRSRKVMLRLSQKASGFFGLGRKEGAFKESLLHEYWKRYYAKKLEELGYQVEVEAPKKHGRVDVLARKDSLAIGIEIETGKSDCVSNVRNCLLSGFGKVLVVTTEERAMRKVEKALGMAGLLIPGRVWVIQEGKGLDIQALLAT